MSQIDQAFIRAYETSDIGACDHEGLSPTIPLPSSAAAPSHGAQPLPDPPGKRQVVSMAAEPIPAPHFQMSAGATDDVQSPTVQIAAGTSAPTATTANAGQRRPLSSFAAAEQPGALAFQPGLEVDAFRWPALIDELLAEHQRSLVPVIVQLLAASDEGRTMVGIVGARSGVGCTTMLLALARMIAGAGKQVAIVDANFADGDLAQGLGLACDAGWEDVLSGRMPLAECVVYSLADRLALLPLRGPCASAGEMLAGIQTSISAGVLRYHYDLVLLDLGVATQSPQATVAQAILGQCRVDATMVVADAASDAAVAAGVDYLLPWCGPFCLGLIGNSAPVS